MLFNMQNYLSRIFFAIALLTSSSFAEQLEEISQNVATNSTSSVQVENSTLSLTYPIDPIKPNITTETVDVLADPVSSNATHLPLLNKQPVDNLMGQANATETNGTVSESESTPPSIDERSPIGFVPVRNAHGDTYLIPIEAIEAIQRQYSLANNNDGSILIPEEVIEVPSTPELQPQNKPIVLIVPKPADSDNVVPLGRQAIPKIRLRGRIGNRRRGNQRVRVIVGGNGRLVSVRTVRNNRRRGGGSRRRRRNGGNWHRRRNGGNRRRRRYGGPRRNVNRRKVVRRNSFVRRNVRRNGDRRQHRYW